MVALEYGFIITRCVTSEKTNKYWNHCVKLIRTFYPHIQIVIIDDASDRTFLAAQHGYINIITIQSEFPGRGEVLPFYYYLKYKWFPNAVILHDSTFVHTHIPFELITYPVIPLWHAGYDKDNVHNSTRIAQHLSNHANISNVLSPTTTDILGFPKPFNICFGAQCFIKLAFLQALDKKYTFARLLVCVKCRTDRCSFERVLGAILSDEFRKLKQHPSLFGDIHHFPNAWTYAWETYLRDLKNGKVPGLFVKIWTGR